MIRDINDLADYVRKSIPFPKAIMNLRLDQRLGAVVFYWQGAEFLVKPSLQVCEVRGNSLFITGLSTLLQSVLVRGGEEEQRLQSILQTLNDAEDAIRTRNQVAESVKYIKRARESLSQMRP